MLLLCKSLYLIAAENQLAVNLMKDFLTDKERSDDQQALAVL